MGSADPEDWAAISQWVNAKDRFFAMQSGERVPIGARWASLSVHELGGLTLTSGQIGACDPFVFLDGCPSFVEVEPGTYQVFVTIADIEGDAPGWVEAYMTLCLDPDASEVRHERLQDGFGVDAWTDESWRYTQTGGTAREGQSRHLDLLLRRREPHRHLGSEARSGEVAGGDHAGRR